MRPGCPRSEVSRNRFRGLERIALAGCPCVFVAGTFRARLLGLAWVTDLPDDCGLLIPGCNSIHTFGMRFALDVAFLGSDGAVLREVKGVPPRRVVRCRGASAVLERRAANLESV
jgi:uncharacterized membrane protein (UPF0127 family)